MALDAHRHFWHYTDAEFGWIADDCLRRDFLPTDCGGMDPCIAVEARQCVEETHWLLELADKHDFIKGVVGWLPLAAPDFPRMLEEFLAEEQKKQEKQKNSSPDSPVLLQKSKLVGLRHVVQDEPDDGFILRPDFVRGVRHALAQGLAYDILVFERQLPNVLKFVDALPDDARLVLDHLGKPAAFDSWRVRVTELARRANVFCKLSGLVTEIGVAADPRPYLDVALEAFGPARLMFGSDWPVVTAHLPYGDWKRCVEDFLVPLAGADQTKIMSANAAAFYGLQGDTR